jgi:anti-anti-sigma factor
MNAEFERGPVRLCRSISRGVGIFTILLGGAVLTGWMFDVQTLKSVIPNLVTMKANTAIAFILCGVSLRLQRDDEGAPARRAATACAAIAAMIGALTLSQYLLGLELGVDELFFKDTSSALKTSAPGRMGSNTALSFSLISGAMLLMTKRRFVSVAHGLALIASVIALLAAVGYVYGSESLYGMGTHTRMAAHTAAGLSVLCLGVLTARPEQGVAAVFTNKYAGGALARRMAPIIIAGPPLIGWLILKGLRAGLYDVALELPLFTVINVVVFSIIILMVARSFSRADMESRASERLLRGRLEERVASEEAARADAERLQKAETESRSALSAAIEEYLALVRSVAEADLTQRLTIKHEGALRELGDGLNRMVESLEESFRAEKEAQAETRRLQEEIIRAKDSALAELSTPLIPVSDSVLVMPLIGEMDSERASKVLKTLLAGVASRRASVAILDITGVPVVDSQVANALIVAAQAVKLLGAKIMLTGIQPNVAQMFVDLGVDMSGIVARGSLQDGIRYAMRRSRAAN